MSGAPRPPRIQIPTPQATAESLSPPPEGRPPSHWTRPARGLARIIQPARAPSSAESSPLASSAESSPLARSQSTGDSPIAAALADAQALATRAPRLEPIVHTPPYCFSPADCPPEIAARFAAGPVSDLEVCDMVVNVCRLPGYFGPLAISRLMEHQTMHAIHAQRRAATYAEVCERLAERLARGDPPALSLHAWLLAWPREAHAEESRARRMLAWLLDPVEHSRHYGRPPHARRAFVCVERDAAMLAYGLQRQHPDFAKQGFSAFYTCFFVTRLANLARDALDVNWPRRSRRLPRPCAFWQRQLQRVAQCVRNGRALTYVTGDEFARSPVPAALHSFCVSRVVRLAVTKFDDY